MRRTHTLILGLAMLVAVGAGVVGATGASPSVDVPLDETENVQQTAACDYEELYDEAIDSVVAIRTDTGQGSGFAYQVDEANGTSYVVTNAHVVGEAESVAVRFARDDTSTGEVVGRDRFTDLAVVRVNGTPGYVEALPVADGSPDHGVGVAAIGNPFGLEETITHGIVSGVNRSMPTELGFSIPNVVQTDAPINPGNSGGPLVTCEGEVVGVNTAGISASRAENVGFAVSGRTVAQVVPTLIRTGEYVHSYLGIGTRPVTPSVATANDLEETDGLYVHEVVENGPSSGVLQGTTGYDVVNRTRAPVGGDVVVAVEGRELTSGEALSSYLLTETRPGDTVTLTVIRDGDRQEVDLTLGERPDPEAATATS